MLAGAGSLAEAVGPAGVIGRGTTAVTRYQLLLGYEGVFHLNACLVYSGRCQPGLARTGRPMDQENLASRSSGFVVFDSVVFGPQLRLGAIITIL